MANCATPLGSTTSNCVRFPAVSLRSTAG